MNFAKVFEFMANENINQSDLFTLIDSIRSMDLSDEQNLRNVIRKVSTLVNKPVTRDTEEQLVQRIKQNGVPEDIFTLFK